MEFKQIKELMAAMERTGTKKLSLKEESGFELVLERGEGEGLPNRVPFYDVSDSLSFRQDSSQRANAALSKGNEFSSALVAPVVPAAAMSVEEANYQYVTSPMVGTFYLSPTPGDTPFVKAGDKIDKNMIVCIIEAMKVMNEVKAGISGTVVEQLVEDGHPVEFGTKLFRIS